MEDKKSIVESLINLRESNAAFDIIAPEVRRLKAEFVEITKNQREEMEKAFREKDGPDVEFVYPHDEWDTQFSELMAQFNKARKAWEDLKAKELNKNLEVKKNIISDLEKLIAEEHHIGHAFEKFNALKDRWKNTGDVPSSDYREIQQEYSHLIEKFFYNIHIYKTLKEYDLQKNLQLKSELTQKVKALLDQKNIREMRELMTAYVKEWDEIGPTAQDQWEKVRDEFWAACREVYKVIGEHYKEQKDQQKSNLDAKEALCEKVESMAAKSEMNDKQWNAALKEIQEIQNEWKNLGFAGKKKNDLVWKRFRAALDSFFEQRKEHQEEMKDVYKAVEEKKMSLINRAEEMKDSVDWKNTAAAFKKLQSDWQRIGASHPAKEQKLWKRFRAASDHFFNNRKAFFDGRENREKENLTKKKEILDKLKALDANSGREQLKEIGKAWNSIGFVPAGDKEVLDKTYSKLLTEKLKALGLKDHEAQEHMFEIKVEGLKDAAHGEEILRNEYKVLGDKLRKIEANIQQYENNLGFFGSNASENPLVKEVMKKIDDSRKEATMIRSRLQKLKQ